MSDDLARIDAPSRERSPDREYSLSVDQVAELYANAGHPRTIRAIQKYCSLAKLDCHKVEIATGIEKYLVAPYSVGRHIAHINEMRTVTIDRDQSRTDASSRAANDNDKIIEAEVANGHEQTRTGAPGREARYVARLEGENEFLRGQIQEKDKTINALLERDAETNILAGRLQEMLAPLLSLSRGSERG